MSKTLRFSAENILQYIKISCQIPDVLEAIATRRIIADAAKEAGIKAELEELQQTADSLRLVNNLVKAEDTWAWLQKYHLSLDEFEEIVETNVLSTKLANHLFADKIEPFFLEHQLNYAGAVLYEVVLDDEDLALELFYALQENEISFQDIAREYIQEPELRRAGGYRGIQQRSELKPEISAAVFATHPPQILKPIVTQKGAHLIWVEEIIQPQLNEPLRLKILGDLFSAWLKQQLEDVKIVAQLELDTNLKPSQQLPKLA
ncbi:MAG: peptidylprolyl isomerase [Actinomycetota bacterium]